MCSSKTAAATPTTRSCWPPAQSRCISTSPAASLPHVHYLRTWADSRTLVAAATQARRAVVIGASFIGLEVAASLRARKIEVHVVGREKVLMENVLGADVGAFLRRLHERSWRHLPSRRGRRFDQREAP